MFDVAIIGTGPAGISAALTLKQLNRNIILFGSIELSSKIRQAEKIKNYPGLIQIKGSDMQKIFFEQLKQENIEITPKIVTGVYNMGSHYSILCNQDMYEAKKVIITTGVEFVKPIEGELEYVGRGVSYCATCDGFLYKGKDIACVCTSKDLEHEITYLASLCRKVYVFALYKDVSIKGDNIELYRGLPNKINGGMKVNSISFRDKEFLVDGVFMLKEAINASILCPGLEMDEGHIVVSRHQETNMKGLFAAGDCTGRPYQYTKAVGEGNVAAHFANDELAKEKDI